MFCLNIKSQHTPARYFSFCILLTVLLVTLSIRSLQGELFITDAQYMVAAGRWIIANGHLPTTDPLSIHSELTYICQQYPICILVAVLYDTFGEMSVRLFFCAVGHGGGSLHLVPNFSKSWNPHSSLCCFMRIRSGNRL